MGGKRGLVLVGLLVLGCAGNQGPVPVRGTVRLDGKPLSGATVLFVPATPGGREATSTANAAGEFRLSTFAARDGALPGKYKVVVLQPADESGSGDAKSSEEAQLGTGKPRGIKKSGPRVPPRYTRPDQTPLTQEVPPPGPVVIDLQGQ